MALFDEQRRMLGVASGGSQVSGIRAGRQRTYKLVFDDVNALVHETATFQISVEVKP